MGLFDSYLDPDQFQDSGGLLGRLLSLQPQQDVQPGAQSPADGQMSSTQMPASSPIVLPLSPASTVPQTPDYGQTQNISIGGNYQMPQFGSPDISSAAPPVPDLGDRLSAGFQSWAHTPAGNPFAALASGMTGFNAGQPTNAAGVLPAQASPPSSAQPPSPDLSDRLSAGFQSWAHTPVGNPLAGLANGVAGLSSGQRVDPANAPQDLNSQYQALRPVLGDRNAMLAIVHPEAGQALLAQALARQQNAGTGGDTNSAASSQPAGPMPAAPGKIADAVSPPKPRNNFHWSARYGQ